MNKVLKSLLLLFGVTTLLSCSKNNDDGLAPLRDYEVQKAADMANIETFMKTHYLTVINNPGSDDDMDVKYTKIPSGGTQVSIWDQTDYPRLERQVTVRQNGVDVNYTIYYLQLRQGSGTDSKSPCNVDNVLAGYRGEYITTETETVENTTVTNIVGRQFEENKNPNSFLSLTSVIRGWSEIFPKFKTGSYTENGDGTISYSDFGAGIMFVPSGLAYFRTGQGAIPAYSPLVFSFKLFEIQRADQDGDGIPSYLEDLNNDGYVYFLPSGVTNPDNSNEVAVLISTNPNKYSKTNETPDFLDTDDDGDGFLTRYEIRINVSETAIYPFADIPTCGSTGNGKKRYLDPTCHN